MAIIKLILFTLICFGTLFASSSIFIDAQITPKWIILIGVGSILGICHLIQHFSSSRISQKKHTDKNILSRGIIILIIFSTFVQALYGIFQFLKILRPTNTFPISGSFDNPAGFAAVLSISIPFYFLAFTRLKNNLHLVVSIIISTIIFAIILSGSRTGIVSVLFVLAYWITKHILHLSRTKRILIVISLIGITVGGLYSIKKASADGRLFIWQCAFPMLKSNYIIGYGKGGFEANYMDHQAQYFRDNPDSHYSKFADNVAFPFCEYIQIMSDYVLIGLALLIIIIMFLFYSYLHQPSIDKETALLCWGVMGILSMFSYPSMYPFVWLILCYSAYILIQNHLNTIAKQYFFIKSKKYIIITCIAILTHIQYKSYQRYQAEIEWAHIANLSILGKTEQILPQYEKLKKILGNNRHFLYNYCNTLYQTKNYNKGLIIAKECRTRWANYNLEILMGNIYENLQIYHLAESHYQLANQMCPNRFLPLYRLFLLFKKTARQDKAILLAKKINNKPIKVPSQLIENIKQEISIYITNK